MKEYFQRDLTDLEEEELAKQLAASPKNSLRFAKQARMFYIQTGLPNPVKSTWHSGAGGAMTLKVVGGLVAGGAMVVTLHLAAHKTDVKPLPVAVPTVTAAPSPQPTPIAVTRAVPVVSKPIPPAESFGVPKKSVMVKPMAYDPGAKYEGLDLIVEREVPGLVTVRVLDSAKKEVRLLYAGLLEKGKWTFPWDGKLSNNDYAQPGIYTVEVQSGKQILSKQINLETEAVADRK